MKTTSNNAIRYNASLKKRAQELRRQPTDQERTLWYEFLRMHACQFRRQKQFGPYIVDFYCASKKLVIEIDGAQHFTQDGVAHDTARTAYLEELGLRVLRFTNDEIDSHFDDVCAKIEEALNFEPPPRK